MAYSSISWGLPGNFVSASMEPVLAFGTQSIGASLKIPSMTPPAFTLWDGVVPATGLINLLTVASGTLTDVTPGITDTVDIDLKVMADLVGTNQAHAKLASLVVLNFCTTDNKPLVIGGTAASPATNPWTSLFTDMTTPANGRLRVQSGYLNAAGQTVAGGLILWTGCITAFAVGASNKVLRLYTAGASVPYRVIVAGRDA